MNVDVRVETLKGVGAAMASKLERLGIVTVADLLNHYPRRYDDFSEIISIRQMKPGAVTFRGKVVNIASRRARGRKLTITEAVIADGTGTVKAIWFNNPYLVKQYPVETSVMVSGNLEFRNNDLALRAPAIELDSDDSMHTGRIVAVYPETHGLTSKQLRTVIRPVLERLEGLPETLPKEIIKEASLVSRQQALSELHLPTSRQALDKARHRLAFEELFFIIAASLRLKSQLQDESAPEIDFNVEVAQEFVKSLPFAITNAQRQSAWQILKDMAQPHPMNRLLEGDVGSGKTVVAFMAATMAVRAGYQAALMVPTDVLARQHFKNATSLLDDLGVPVELVLSKQPAADKAPVLARIKAGQPGLIIGTHALLGESVEFSKLGLVIIDEQHRFGVNQRQQLKTKSRFFPHLLSMTATPIPRSLALTVYGDLDVSIIDELPAGRKPIATKVVSGRDKEVAYGFIDGQIKLGRQVFVVCPLIDDSDSLDAKSVNTEVERLRSGLFRHRRIEALHARLTPPERQKIMERFVAGDIDILVSTTVVEVGVDIPNATVMLVEGAERFGLATLHQLRGRVGRSQHDSYCFLASDSSAPGARERLEAMERTQDGFRLSQIDLELRGPGQIYGKRQHGLLDLRLANLTDTKLVSEVRAAARRFVDDPAIMVQYPQITERIQRLQAITTLD
ncbi:ATP-dependent DNA helicase RecG [Patescibacteria group bacterium]|nr:MAG: ATP-dependent DNA helicase RecG [Patescibacteria group bacterium]